MSICSRILSRLGGPAHLRAGGAGRTWVVAAALAAVSGPSALGQLSASTPSSQTLIWWRFEPTKGGKPLVEWAESALTDTALSAISVLDGDEPTTIIAQASTWALARGFDQTGVFIASTDAVTVAAAPASPLGAPPSLLAAPPAAPAAPAAPSPTASAPPQSETPATPAATRVRLPGMIFPGPTGFQPAGERSAAIEVVVPSGVTLDLNFGEAAQLDVETVTIKAIEVKRSRNKAWARSIWVAQNGDRLVFATDRPAMEFALAPRSGADAGADILREDFLAQRRAVSQGRQAAPTSAAQLFINFNLMRQEFEESFVVGRGARLLALWGMQNVRSLSVHAGVLPSQPGRDATPPILLLDAAWSARSDNPGEAMTKALTSSVMPGRQSGLQIPDAAFLMVTRENIRPVADWFIKTHLATLPDQELARFVEPLQLWLGDHRPELGRSGEAIKPWLVVGPRRLADPTGKASIPFRASVRSGTPQDALARDLAKLASAFKLVIDPPMPANPDEPIAPGAAPLPARVWSVPMVGPGVSGHVGWGFAQAWGQPVIAGSITLGDTNSVQLTRAEVTAVDALPKPRVPLSVPDDALPPKRKAPAAPTTAPASTPAPAQTPPARPDEPATP
jgi:hypothetical protein